MSCQFDAVWHVCAVECLDLSVSQVDCSARAPHSWLLFHGILMTLRDECSSVLLCLPL